MFRPLPRKGFRRLPDRCPTSWRRGSTACSWASTPACGRAPLGHHYAGRGNQFWRLLHEAGLTPRLYRPEEDATPAAIGLGSTNLVARATASAAELSRAELRGGVPRLARIVAFVRPRVLAYTGKGVYLAATGLPDAPWGVQERPLFDGVADVWCRRRAASPACPFEEKLRWFREVRAEIDRRRPAAVAIPG
ncbi:mismatch-specific DNA-glycosylase [Azospirillum sp. INR13]|uniref:mismatch-specific DNA-glycosylase n=1 Tax=Azospirillum sp. INR13 TaxID=2596919 RepID=UPI002103D176|nr:mismatch-specific DNA-glycosylase [Azospirillum sp. INR13]